VRQIATIVTENSTGGLNFEPGLHAGTPMGDNNPTSRMLKRLRENDEDEGPVREKYLICKRYMHNYDVPY